MSGLLDNIEWASLPMGSDPARDMPAGYDDMGNPLRRNRFGVTYAVKAAPPRQREGKPWSGERVKSIGKGMARGILDAVTAPGRAARGESLTNGAILDLAGMVQLGGAAMPAPKGALRSGAVRVADEVGETAAQQVARMLRDGRAADVTDDLMARVDPQEMHALYKSGATGADMPMDAASRMARARDMGFDTDTLHGTTQDIASFDVKRKPRDRSDPGIVGRAVYTSPEPRTSGIYSVGEGAQQYPLTVKTGKHHVASDGGVPWEKYHPGGTLSAKGGAAWQKELQAAGHDGVTFRFGDEIMQLVTFDPRNIRSRFARFDPRLSHLANLSASNAAPGVGLLSLTDDEREALRRYLEAVK